MNLNEVLGKARRGRLSAADITFLAGCASTSEQAAKLKPILKAARKGRLPVAVADSLVEMLVPRVILNGEPLPVRSAPETSIVEHPKHYNLHPSGVECIAIVEHMNFNLGNAVKCIWRAGEKGALVQDLKKACWYLNREIARVDRSA